MKMFPPTKEVWTNENLTDEHGRTIVHRIIIAGENLGREEFIGQIIVVMQPPHPSLPPREIPIMFHIPTPAGALEAFGAFDESAQEALEKFKKEVETRKNQPNIVVPQAMGSPRRLFGPNGRPLQ